MKSAIPLDRSVSQCLSHAAVTLREDLTIDEALTKLRSGEMVSQLAAGGASTQVLYFYIVNAQDQLVGVLPSRQLILSPAGASVGDVMTRQVIMLGKNETLFDAMELFAMYRLLAIPVVDEDKRLLGIVEVTSYTDEVFDLAQNQQLNEVFQLIGLRLEQHKQGSPLKGFRLRLPWLLSNITGGLICAGLGSFFEATVQQVVLVALFIPVILTLAESVSVQSMTLAIEQAMSKRSYPAELVREVLTSLLLGLCSGAVVGGVSLIWREPLAISWTIGGVVCVTMLLASVLGRVIPQLIHLMKLNPRLASGPITLAAVDVMTISIYMSAATLVLAHGKGHV